MSRKISLVDLIKVKMSRANQKEKLKLSPLATALPPPPSPKTVKFLSFEKKVICF